MRRESALRSANWRSQRSLSDGIFLPISFCRCISWASNCGAFIVAFKGGMDFAGRGGGSLPETLNGLDETATAASEMLGIDIDPE